MAFEFKLPDIGEGVVEGEIVKWLVKPGDNIAIDQPMVEVMTDKATVVIPSPRAGIVVETRGKEGEIAKVHAVLVIIEEGGAVAARPHPQSKQQPQSQPTAPRDERRPAATRDDRQPQAAHDDATVIDRRLPPLTRDEGVRSPPPVRDQRSALVARASNGSHVSAHEIREPGGKVLAAPATRRLARELGVDLGALTGTGPAGRVTSEDVRRAAEGAPMHSDAAGDQHREAEVRMPPRAPATVRMTQDVQGDERVAVRGLRKRIWDNMALSSSTAAHFTFVEECDVTDLVEVRERFNHKLDKGEDKLTFLPFIVKSVIAALKKFPDLNAHVDDEKLEFIRRRDFHLGIAVASERGLIVPVVRYADRRSILDLAREIKRLSDAVRSSQLRQEDLGGSTFTITSLGKDGGIFATPIINYPEVAIMGVHKISKRPMVHEDRIVIRDMMNLSLSFDHRLIDGHIGAAFTYAVIKLLEHPDRLMMEMT